MQLLLKLGKAPFVRSFVRQLLQKLWKRKKTDNNVTLQIRAENGYLIQKQFFI